MSHVDLTVYTASVAELQPIWKVGNYGFSDYMSIEIDILSMIASISDISREKLIRLNAKGLKQSLREFEEREDAHEDAALLIEMLRQASLDKKSGCERRSYKKKPV